jgi:hypothetical protein
VNLPARWLIVAFTISAWVSIFNHCAIHAVATRTDSSQAGCPFHSKPAKSHPQSSGIECCKILRAVSPAPIKSPAPIIVDFSNVDLFPSPIALLVAPKISFEPATLDTGPPGKTLFVELIGSLRAHAPPFLT